VTTLLAVLVVGVGSLAFRLTPLLGARRLPEALVRVAARAGMSALAALVVRTVVQHRDPSVPDAPLLAALSLATGLAVAALGRPVLVALAAGTACYLALGVLLAW
jgi:branched-subunit amino acid transport protein